MKKALLLSLVLASASNAFIANAQERPASAAIATANYSRPAGAWYSGVSRNFNALEGDNAALICPAGAYATWTANAEGNVTWEMTALDGSGITLSGEGQTFTPTLSDGYYTRPTVTVDGTTAREAGVVKAGGGQLADENGDTYGAGVFDVQKGFTYRNGMLSGYNPYAIYSLKTLFMESAYTPVVVKAVGNYMEKPATPYTISKAGVVCFLNGYTAGTFTLKVYKASKDFDKQHDSQNTDACLDAITLGELIAEATLSATDPSITTYQDNTGTQWAYLPFDLGQVYSISDAIVLQISGFDTYSKQDDHYPQIYMFTQAVANVESKANYSYAWLDLTANETGETAEHNLPTSIIAWMDDEGNYLVDDNAYAIFVDAEYPDTATGIDHARSGEDETAHDLFDLNGRKISKPVSGQLYVDACDNRTYLAR